MKKLRPRVRYFGGITTAVVFLLVSGFMFHYLSQRRQRRMIERRCDVLEKRLQDLENVVSLANQRPEVSVQNASDSLSSSNLSRSRENSTFNSSRFRPRLLGRGSSGNWVYSDLRLPSGEVRRYFARKNSTAQDMALLLANIRADVQDSLEMPLVEGPFQESSFAY